MTRTLVLLFHPDLRRSRANAALARAGCRPAGGFGDRHAGGLP
ncbi:MAG: hypothetical protein U5N10_02355 [Gemmobacter sp.]|nr:hypothetical protein [Gemmobacter sp.]